MVTCYIAYRVVCDCAVGDCCCHLICVDAATKAGAVSAKDAVGAHQHLADILLWHATGYPFANNSNTQESQATHAQHPTYRVVSECAVRDRCCDILCVNAATKAGAVACKYAVGEDQSGHGQAGEH
jgi:hypothetical protein